MTVESGFDDYLRAQQENLEQIRRLPHFVKLIEPVHVLYERSIDALAPDRTRPLFGRLLLVCHKALLSAATLIGRAMPSDSAGVTRRAIEAACLARAIKHSEPNLNRWRAYEERLKRWEARHRGERPPRPNWPKIDAPPQHKIVKSLRAQLGMLSDAAVHFTPEFFEGQDWKLEDTGGATLWIRLQYFEPSQREIERELVALAGIHVMILELFNECFDGAFHGDPQWRALRAEIQERGNALARATGLPVDAPQKEG